MNNHYTTTLTYSLHAWIFSAVLFACSILQAADYTITTSSGDYRNLANVGLEPGDTVWLEAQTRERLILQNIQGTAANPITITNTGGQFIIDNDTNDKGLQFWNCKHIIVKGTPDPENYDYGIKIAQVSAAGGMGVSFIQGTTDFEVHHVEISNTGFAGLMAKSDGLDSSEFTMENVSVHDLYIHNTGGEALYIGSSFFSSQDPHEIHGIEIYNNLIVNAGWDAIQLGCATQDAAIYNNVILGYGTNTTDVQQNEGIRINPGTSADIYNNWIEGGRRLWNRNLC